MSAVRLPDAPRTAARPATAARGVRGWWARADRGIVVLGLLYLFTLPFVAHRMTASDAIEYYAYDRSLYFDGDFDFANDYRGFYDRDPKTLAKFKEGFIDKTNPAGNAINNGPAGSALLWSPFFLVGDLAARVMHAAGSSILPDGYSDPYIRAVSYGAAIYAGLALLLTYLLARAITNAPAAFWASLAIWLATPALFYSHLAPTYAHATSWFAASAFLTVWFRTRERRGWRGWVALGLLGGLVAMVREQDAVFLAVPAVDEALRLLPSLQRPDGAWRRDVARTLGYGVLMGACALVAFTPQLIVYKVLNGEFRPSTEVSDKLLWHAPNALRVLFDPQHGMFLWAPILAVAFVGLGLLIARDYRLGLSLATGFLLTWYLNGAFQTWSTAGSFGARRFIVCGPIFAVGLAEVFRRFGMRGEKAEGRRQKAEGKTHSTQHSALLWVPIVVIVAILWNGGLILQFVRQYMDRQQLEWPLVLVNQFTVVPRNLVGDLWRFLHDPASLYNGGRP